jgi:hypothetical protein
MIVDMAKLGSLVSQKEPKGRDIYHIKYFSNFFETNVVFRGGG